MSTVTNVLDTTNQLYNDYDFSKFLLGFNWFISGTVTATGADVVTVQGMVMGRIAATQLLTPADKDSTDGSQIPVGLCVIGQTIDDGDTTVIQLVNKGKVAEAKVNFLSTETLATLIGPANNQRSYRDYLEDLGLILETSVDNTAYDNS